MLWSYFGIGHSKGEHDEMSVVVKQWLQHYQLDCNGVTITCVANVVGLLNVNLQLGVYSMFGKRQHHQETN